MSFLKERHQIPILESNKFKWNIFCSNLIKNFNILGVNQKIRILGGGGGGHEKLIYWG